MPAPRIRGDYDSLAQISQAFARRAADTQRTIQRIKRQINTLQGGDWIGKGAKAFYREMDSEVLPSLKRLATALETANRATRQIIQILRAAEEDAARIFRAVGVGGVGAAISTAIGGTVGLASWQEVNPLLIRDPNSLFTDDFMRGLIGSQFQGAGRELGDVMNGLMQNPTGDELDQFIQTLAGIRDRLANDMRAEYDRFQEIRDQRDATNPDTPPGPAGGAQSSFTGSNTQMRYGSVVGDAFGIDPVFGAMLNPTGGLVGPGNWAIAGGDTAVGYHSVVHDAAGYLHNYHQVGPGYDYLGLEGRDTSSPLSGQHAGIAYWRQATGGPSPTSAPAQWAMGGAVGGIDLGSELIDRAKGIF